MMLVIETLKITRKTMTTYITKHNLSVHPELIHLLENEILPGLNITEERVWAGFSKLVHDLAPKN